MIFKRKKPKPEPEPTEYEKRVEELRKMGIEPISEIDKAMLKKDIDFLLDAMPQRKLNEVVGGLLYTMSKVDKEIKDLMLGESADVVHEIVAFCEARLSKKKSIAILIAFLYSTLSSHMDLLMRDEDWQHSVVEGLKDKTKVKEEEFKGYG